MSSRYWVASTPDDFNSGWWSTTSDGTPGASIPGPSNSVVFDAGGQGDCTVNTDVNIYSLKEAKDYRGTIYQDSGSIITGDASFLGGTFVGTSLSFTVKKNLTFSKGFSWQGTDSSVDVRGDVYCNAGFIPETDGTVLFRGSNNQALYCNGGVLPNVIIDKTTSNQVKAFGSSSIYIDGDFYIFDGTFNTHGHDIIMGT